MEEFNKDEFERRIRFEEGIKKDVEHLRDDFEDHQKDGEKYMEKFEKIQESHNNILNRINNVEDDIVDLEDRDKDIKGVQDNITKIDAKILVLKFALAVVGLLALAALSTHPVVFKLIKPLISLILGVKI